MKKLSIRVHKCHILRGGDYVDVNPRVVILVDSTYRFQTSMKRSTFDPSFEETFIVGNTHRRAVIEVSVYDSGSTSILPGLVSGVVGLGQRPNHRRYSSLMRGVILPTAPVVAGSSGAGGAVNDTDRNLLGRCYISIERLVQGEAKTRDYVLGSVGAPELPWLSAPEGVAGSITITLQSDVLGEPRERFCLDSALELTYTLRLKRLLLLYDKSQLQIIDLMIAHVRAIAEEAGSVTQKGTTSPNVEVSQSEDLEAIVVGGDPSKGVPGIPFYRPKGPETFQQLMSRLCRQYGGMEPTTFSVVVCVYGCTNINCEAFNTSVVGSDNVYAILRTENEDFTSSTSSLQETLVWTESNEITLDVVNPSSFVLHVVVMGRSAARHYEIGRTTLSVATLALEHSSTRHMFLCSFESTLSPRTTGIVHVSLKPLNFGLTPLEIVKHVDNFYDRLGTFFKRYDPSRVPNIDALVHSRLGDLEEFMQDLVVEHGREPGSVRLLIAISEVVSLKEDVTNELNDRSVQLVLSMGSTTVRTKSAKVRCFAPTKFSDSYCFDVVRETDIICVEVIRRGDPSIVYGRVHFSCLNIQKGVSNQRTYYLVGESGTPRAFLSGIIRLSLFSDQVGHTYKVDTQTEALYTGRLRRYAYRRLPEALHRVNLAVATVFDMEAFMAKLSQQYGDEDPTYAVYFTVLGCRQLKARFGGISPYVMVRVGVDAYYTKFVHDCKEPDFFEYCEFFFDRQSDTFITLIVMDHSGIGNDTEIGRVVISISDAQLGQQYHDFLPLQSPNPRSDVSENGSVGFKYTVTDLNLVDRTRVHLIKKSHPCHKPHLRDDGRPIKRNTPEDMTDKRTRSGFLSKLNLWRRRVAAPMTLSAGARQTSNSNLSDVSLKNSSFDRLSDLVSDASIADGVRPTSNLMDEGIMSMEEFCSVPTGGTKSVSNTEDSDNDLGELLNHSETIAQITGSVAQISEDMGQMQLRVRALYCKQLYCTSKEKPNPYLLLSTMGETHRSRMEFNTVNPNYNEEFTFKVTDPCTDFLRVTVLSDTPYGAKKLGHCVLCLQNVQRAEPHTRWVTLVVDSHSPSAFEHGSICLSLMGVNFGLDYLPSTEAENRLRERLRDFLLSVGGQHLHRLEWFVGEYSLHEYALPRLFGKAYVSQSVANSATLQITIGSVSKLMFEDARVDGNCVVKVRIAGRTRAKTRPVVGTNGYFRFDETFQLTVDNPTTAVIRLGVTVNGREKAGVCYLSLADLHRGVAQERTHLLVAGPKTDDPFPAGLVTVSLLSGNYGSSSAPPTVEEETRFLRLQHYFYYYKRKELAMADVCYSTTLNVNAYIRQLVDKWGPEPGNYRLHLTINGCNNLNLYSAAILNPFCLVRCGLDEYRTKIVHGRSDCVFNESFDLHIGLPDMEKVELILMDFSPAKSVEIGRTQVFLNTIRRDVVNSLRPLLVNHSSKSAGVTGGVDMELYTEDFGDGNMRTQSSTSLPCNSRNDASFSREPSTLGIAPSGTFQTRNALVATVGTHYSSGAENSEMSLPEGAPQGGVRAGAADIQLPVRVTFTSVKGSFPKTKEVYLRVTDGDKTLLYTKSTPLEELETMHATFEVLDVASIMDLVFTLKIGVHGFLGVSSTVCYADFCLNRCAPSKITKKTLRLYGVSGNFLGICTMDVDVPNVTFPNSNAIPSISPRMAESIKDDLASLVMKFSPLDLHHLDLAFRVGDAKGMHRSLRTQLAPDVIFTVYVVIREVRLDVTVKNTMCVSAVVGADYDEVPKRPAGEIFPYGMRFLEARTGEFCPLRVDIATPSSEGVPLTLCVLDRSGKKKAVELGRSVVSLRALLTPATFESFEQLTVPLVQVRYGANRAHATLVGSLTFSVAQPAFEGCPSLLRFPIKETANFNREYVRYYRWRINDLMKHYDANFLVDLHYKLYERFAATNTWREGLPKWLSELVTQWGPEMGPIMPVPVLKD